MSTLPKHIAIIMDGNGRWAQKRGLPRSRGHHYGVQSARSVIETAIHLKIKVLTLFAFGEENWGRSVSEVRTLLRLLSESLKKELPTLIERNVQLRIIGNLNRFPKALQTLFKKAQALTAQQTGLKLIIALSYSGRWDICHAARRLAFKVRDQDLDPESITESMFAQELVLPDLPEPDLMIRTSGEQRISNFMLWQFAYTEFYFSGCYWPDFDQQAFRDAIQVFMKRERRFGLEQNVET